MFSSLLVVCVLAGVVVVNAGSCREANLCCPGRDSSCVVQKAVINAIQEDISDKPCYCDHACLKLGDCCTDFKEACGVVDCDVSEWAPWSSCDVKCGAGMMQRARKVLQQAMNGGKHCPGLIQKRGCQGVQCEHRMKTPLREIAMLLPASLSNLRRINETSDIRRNLRSRYPLEPDHDYDKEYCVEFEILKASKACRKEKLYSALREGERVCVRCESQALRKYLDWRCQGHGVEGRSTRWSALSAPHCHGKWLRVQHDPSLNLPPTTDGKPVFAFEHQPKCSTKTCSKEGGPAFIFV